MPIANQRIGTIVTALVLIAAVQEPIIAQLAKFEQNSAERLAQVRFERITASLSVAPERDALALVELVMEHHWMPPVRQELIWKGIQYAYQFSGLYPPADTAQEIPATADPKELSDFLLGQKKQWLAVGNLTEEAQEVGFEELFATGIMESIPGGAEIVAAKQAKVNESLAANRYVGVGIQLSMKVRPLVTKVLYGGSGRKAGMLDGDLILEIDDQTTEGESLAEVVNRLRGPEGSTVKMRLKQPDGEARTIEVVRSVTFIPTVLGWSANDKGEQQFFFPSDESIAYLKIEQIGPSTVHELKQAAKALRKMKLRCIVLDLRSGGGRLHDAVMVGDLFLDKGTLGYTQYRDRQTEHESLPGKLFPDIPIVAFVGPEMGADRVLLAAAFQDSGEIILAGDMVKKPAFVRKQFSLPSGASVIFPVGILRRGNGEMLCPPIVSATLLSSKSSSSLKPDHSWPPPIMRNSQDTTKPPEVLWPKLLRMILADQEKNKTNDRS